MQFLPSLKALGFLAHSFMNNRSDFFIVNVGAFEFQFDLLKLGKPKEKGDKE